TAEQRHLAAFEILGGLLGARTGPLAFVAAAGGLAMPAADTSAHTFLLLHLVPAMVDGGQVHYRFTPPSRATSSLSRSIKSPRMVALTRLMGLVLPCVLVRIFLMPHASSTSRTPGPALTPVPGPAGTRMTRLEPNWPITRCGIVSPFKDTFFWRFIVS